MEQPIADIRRDITITKSLELQEKAHRLIPGGCHTYAKGDDQYPENSPKVIVSGSGCHVTDADGNTFMEFGMGLRSVTLGHGNRRVAEAAYRASLNGTNFLRPSVLEIELAEEMLSLLPHGDMIKFGKNGSDVTTAAIKLSRAHTGRDLVAVPSNQPFFSVDDWFIGTTDMDAGIPDSVKKMTVQFEFDNLESVKALFEQYPGQIACLIMEPAKYDDPSDHFLHRVRDLCHEHGALFILDEIITGFRWHLNGAQAYYNIQADLSTFGKAMGNGFSVAALIGKRELMEAGGLRHDGERVFLLSQTYGAETGSLAAALETIKIYREEPVIETLWARGRQLESGLRSIIDELSLHDYFTISGKPCCLVFGTNDENKQPSQPFRTLFMQEAIKQGLLLPSLIVSYAHTEKDIERAIEGIGEALVVYKKAIHEGIDKYLHGKSVQPVFRKYN
ncbi:glutamate-1-semialdehyde 2,1-aminomutase [Gracilimonas sp. 8A47]|uniref:Glutamate-1-semialdehyde 2,1-aminomutase n=1 Tax=Rhodohalobacter mucosus TaxID=2079485 RepID=A0A316TXK9_9BACT|nr:glutamate-1-semialdehyde 2,1-aminomutase [Rhodohalobacter mucosus]